MSTRPLPLSFLTKGLTSERFGRGRKKSTRSPEIGAEPWKLSEMEELPSMVTRPRPLTMPDQIRPRCASTTGGGASLLEAISLLEGRGQANVNEYSPNPGRG